MIIDRQKEHQRIGLNPHQVKAMNVLRVEEDLRTEMEWTNILKMFIILVTILAKVVAKFSPPRTKSAPTIPETVNRKPEQLLLFVIYIIFILVLFSIICDLLFYHFHSLFEFSNFPFYCREFIQRRPLTVLQ